MTHNFGGFASPGNWFKGNLHLHSKISDGAQTPKEVRDFYRERGYAFTALTDHMPSKGKGEIPAHPAQELSTEDFLVLRGAEYAIPVHLGVVGPGFDYQPDEADGWGAALKTWWDRGAFCWVAHPYWGNLGTQHLETLEFLPAFEVYNNVCEIIWGKGLSSIHWDRVLSLGKPLVGMAVDDAHAVDKHGAGGWVMVKSEELTEEAIVAALRRGDFYSSRGPLIEDICFQDAEEKQLRIRCSPARCIRLISVNGHGHTVEAPAGELLTDVLLNWSWQFWGSQSPYMRVEVVDDQGRTAWSQPIYHGSQTL